MSTSSTPRHTSTPPSDDAELAAFALDDSVADPSAGMRYLREGWLPLRRLPDGTALVAVSSVVDDDARAAIEAELRSPAEFVFVGASALRRTVLRFFTASFGYAAANALSDDNPVLSAKTVFSRGQAVGSIAAAVAVVLCAVIWPAPTAIVALVTASLVFLAGTAFKFSVAIQGARYDVVERVTAAEVAALRDEDLPVYTILVPVFREANIVAQLIGNLENLDYPVDKLEVLILTEEEDQETRDAIAGANPPAHFHVVTVPKGHPQTKPRACNVGLYAATGEYLVIYDAEDTPDADQLKKAIVAFERGGEETVCVQAALNYFNAGENVLTRMFTLEYSFWFDYMLSGLDYARLPIPLGGTSNHFRTKSLAELGGWDPYNVTEDADLGIRASAIGYRVGVIDSTTMEEANTSIPNFLRQRSRWIKGYMQTSLVHARRPLALLRTIGLRRFLSFVLLIAGTPATFLLVAPFTLLTLASLVVPVGTLDAFFPPWALWICLFNFVVGNAIVVYLSMMGPFKRGTFALIPWALLNPLYWMLHCIAAYKALWQLLTKPHYWEKTEHGLTTQTADDPRPDPQPWAEQG